MEKSCKLFIENLKKSRCAIAMTGAGVSVASGIPDFRSSNGLFSMISQHTFELNFFTSQPAEYYKIAQQYIHTLADKKPNITHKMLAVLENKGFLNAIITQNIDRLHQKAGSQNVIEFHGNVATFHCIQCFNPYVRKQVDSKIDSDGIPKCDKCGSLIRPDIVFYGDMIPKDVLVKSDELCEKCDLFIVLGTSLVVNPAAALTETAHYNGAKVIIITKGITPYDEIALHKFEVDLEKFSHSVIDCL